MIVKNNDHFFVLRKMMQKGYTEVLQYINEKDGIHYNDILRYAIDKKIIKSRSSITLILNDLTDIGLLIRTVSSMRPIRTTYSVSKEGGQILRGLTAFEKEISK